MTTTNNFTGIIPAHNVQGPSQGSWTYTDYAALPVDGRRYEIMDGVLLMAPAPSPIHQNAANWFAFYLTQHVVLTGLGKVFPAPIDVELAPNRIVQPDVSVLLSKNLGKVTASRIIGAPDLVVEVASPGTAAYDRLKKLDAYMQAGVQEYWIANPDFASVEVLWLRSGGYSSQGVFEGSDTLPSLIVPAIGAVKVDQFFA